METAPTSIEVLLRPTLGQSDEPSDLRGSLSPTSVYSTWQSPGGHPSNYEPGATSLNFSDRANHDERTPYLNMLTLKALSYFVKNMETKGFFPFEIITTVLISPFCFISIPICYGSIAIINVFTLTVRGSTLDVKIKTSDSNV